MSDLNKTSKLSSPDFYAKGHEANVVASVMISREAYAQVSQILTPDMFADGTNKKLYMAVVAMEARGADINLVSLAHEIGDGYTAYALSKLTESTLPSTAMESALVAREKWLKRNAYKELVMMVQSFNPKMDSFEILDGLKAKLDDFARRNIVVSHSIDKYVKEVLEHAILESEEKSARRGMKTHFETLDKIIGGLGKGNLIVVAGRPGSGKTSFASSIALNIIERGGKVGMFSMEMTSTEIIERFISMMSGVNTYDIKNRTLDAAQLKAVSDASDTLAGWKDKLFINDTPALPIGKMRTLASEMKRKSGIDIIMVDYLQLMKSGKEKSFSREQEVADVSMFLKELAKILDVPVIALAQLNRESEARPDKRPMLSDLRSSGQIEQDSDVIMFVFRPEMYDFETYDDYMPTENTAEIIIGKNRHGATGVARLAFHKETTKFGNLAISQDVYHKPADMDDESYWTKF